MNVLVGIITAPKGRDSHFQLVPPVSKRWFLLRDGGWEELEVAEGEHLRPAHQGLTWDDHGPCNLGKITGSISRRIFYDLNGFLDPNSGVMLGTMGSDTDLAFWVTLPPGTELDPTFITDFPEQIFWGVPSGTYLEFVLEPSTERWRSAATSH